MSATQPTTSLFATGGSPLPAPYSGTGSFRGLSVFVLKIAAIVGMTCNHVANVFADQIPFLWLVFIFGLGGITFPIFAFLLIEGYTHTSNLKRYLIRLLAFALVSQIPFSLLWGAEGNVFFTLLTGVLLLYAYDNLPSKPLFVVVFLVVVFAGEQLMDWGGIGTIIIVLFYVLRKPPFNLGRAGVVLTMAIPMVFLGFQLLQAVVVTAPDPTSFDLFAVTQSYIADNSILQAGAFAANVGGMLYYLMGFGIALILMLLYNGRHGRSMKWFFYAYYPIHLFVIWVLKVTIFV